MLLTKGRAPSEMTDFDLYFAALNQRLASLGRKIADDQRARVYFEEQLPNEQAANLEIIEQDLEALA